MIIVLVKKKKDNISFVQIKGHANYADYGKDIVCASVSSIVTTTVNAIVSFDSKSISYQEQPTFVIQVVNDGFAVQTLLHNMLVLFQELEIQYPKNIKIRWEEIL